MFSYGTREVFEEIMLTLINLFYALYGLAYRSFKKMIESKKKPVFDMDKFRKTTEAFSREEAIEFFSHLKVLMKDYPLHVIADFHGCSLEDAHQIKYGDLLIPPNKGAEPYRSAAPACDKCQRPL